jgi:hypothetical protein
VRAARNLETESRRCGAAVRGSSTRVSLRNRRSVDTKKKERLIIIVVIVVVTKKRRKKHGKAQPS